MDLFYDFTIYRTTKTKVKNELGQLIDVYVRATSINCDVQPSDATLVKKSFGDDIICNFIVFCNEAIAEGDIVVYNNKPYLVKKGVDWIEYKIYAIQSTNVKVQNA